MSPAARARAAADERADLITKIAHEVDSIPGVSVEGVRAIRARLENTSTPALREIWANRDAWMDAASRSVSLEVMAAVRAAVRPADVLAVDGRITGLRCGR